MHPYQLGNILTDFAGLRNFWATSESLPEFWKALRKPEACGGCEMHSTCRSGSTTRRIVELGEFNEHKTTGKFEGVRDPLCPKDYLERHPKRRSIKAKSPPIGLKAFKEIAVRHSL